MATREIENALRSQLCISADARYFLAGPGAVAGSSGAGNLLSSEFWFGLGRVSSPRRAAQNSGCELGGSKTNTGGKSSGIDKAGASAAQCRLPNVGDAARFLVDAGA